MAQTKPDVFETLTNRVIDALEKGVRPWEMPWQAEYPQNGVTGKPYRGVNALSAWLEMQRLESPDSRFLTFNQAKAAGYFVKAGAKGIPMVKWVDMRRKDSEVDTGGTPEEPKEEKTFLAPVKFTVFHASFIEGLPPAEKVLLTEPGVAAQDVDTLVYAEEVRRGVDAARAFYSPTTDEIFTPPYEKFKSEAHYVSTVSHELAHATGHPSRLNRTFGKVFGSPEYAREELRAELATVFLAAARGYTLDSDIFQNNTAYIGSWLKALREDKREIMRAASDAEKAVRHIEHALELHIAQQAAVEAPTPTVIGF